MPAPVQAWVAGTPITAASLDIALYTTNGTNDHPNGIAFHAARPLLVEAYTTAASLVTSPTGHQSSLAGSGTATTCAVVYDTAGYFGMYSDQSAGTGYYQFLAAVNGSAGDGVTSGGWSLLFHCAAVAHKSTQTSISADLLGTAQTPVSGTRQPPSSTLDSTAFFLDLVNAGEITWTPAVTVYDSSSAAASLVVTADSSGETCRFCSLWAAVSATSAGSAFFPNSTNSPYPFTAPAGVVAVTVAAFGGGGQGGGGASGASERGGGGGGGAEFRQDAITTHGGGNYSVAVGGGGSGGGAGGSGSGPGAAGAAGGLSEMVGDGGSQVIAHGGSGGQGATSTTNGTGGAGGTGGTGATHFDGGAGAAGKTSSYGGGGGSSAGTAAAGNTATTAMGAPAPSGGGPGGQGGTQAITLVQNLHASGTDSNTLTVSFKAVQQGNAVIAFVYYQGVGPSSSQAPPDPTVALNDGTALDNVQAADVGSKVSLNVCLYAAYGVPGGETSLTITGQGTNNSVKAILAQIYEVNGLGPSPQVDAQSSHTQGPSHPDKFYQSSPGSPATPIPVPHGPDLWLSMVGAQQTSSFTIVKPPSSQGWTVDSPQYVSNGGTHGAIMTCWQTQNAPGNMLFACPSSGGFNQPGGGSIGVTKGSLSVAITTSALTGGNPPVIGPGGGGGAGLGAGNAGGQGYDGQVTLNWVAPSGSGYGTPALPAPNSSWTTSATLGTASPPATIDVNGPAGIRDVCNFLSNPPTFRISQAAATPVTSSSITTVPFTGATPTVDSYSGWNTGTSTYTVPRDGLYLVHGLACFTQASGGLRMAAVTVNGTTYWGPPSAPTSAGTCNVAKTQILSLHANDVVSFGAYQTSGAPVNLATTDQTRFLLAFLCESTLPQGTWSPPDTTFRWTAGTRGENLGGNLTALLQQHLASDLGFLVNRPFFTGYQTIAQTSLAAGSFTTVTLNQVQGYVHHADVGDSYNGWDGTSTYTAAEPGWYLCVGEVFASNPTTTGCTVTAALLPSTSGGVAPAQTPDVYQQLVPPTTFGGGAALVAMQYLLAGESLALQVRASGYTAPYQTIVGTRSGAFTNSHLEMIWMSQ